MAILLSAWSCQQESEEIPGPASSEEGKLPLSFELALPEDIICGTDILPMSRSTTDDTIKSNIDKKYKAIIIKQITENWYIDTILDPILTSDYPGKNEVPIDKNSTFLPLKVELRPGVYKIGIFLNPGNMVWDENLKPGTFVATDTDLKAGKNILPAYNIPIHEETRFIDGRLPASTLAIGREIFTGMKDFKVEKNPSMGNSSSSTPISVPLERRVARFRFLLKVPYPEQSYEFGHTQYTLAAHLNSQPDEYFCEGLDVLGRPYTGTRTSLVLYSSTSSGDDYYSEIDNSFYQMTVNIPEHFPNHRASGATFYFPFILVDKPMECTLKIDYILGQSDGGYNFYYEPGIPYTLEANTINGVALEHDSSKPWFEDGFNYGLYAKIIPEVDVSASFHPYYEWNAHSYDHTK